MTTGDVLDGVGGQATFDFRFEVLDVDGNQVDVVHPSVTSTPQVAWNPSNRITRTLTGVRLDPTEAAGLIPGQHRIRPVFVVALTGGEYPLGVFLYVGGAQLELAGGTWVDCTVMPDLTWVLDQKLADMLQVAAVSILTTAALSVVRGGGIPVASIDIAASPTTLGVTPLTYVAGKDSRLACLDQITNLLAYLPCYFDRDATFVMRPVPVPSESWPGRHGDANDPTSRSHRFYQGQGGRVDMNSVSTSTKLTPNVYLVYSTSPSGGAVAARYDVPASNANSKENIGFPIVRSLDVPGLVDNVQALAAATAQAKRDAATATTVTFTSAPDPRHDAWGIVDFNGTLYLEVSWTLELSPGGKHTHVLAQAYS